MKISRQEVLKIASISRIHLSEHEVDVVAHQLTHVLSYASCVAEVATTQQFSLAKNINIFRSDESVPTSPEPILAQAPEHQESYFVVPSIIEQQ